MQINTQQKKLNNHLNTLICAGFLAHLKPHNIKKNAPEAQHNSKTTIISCELMDKK